MTKLSKSYILTLEKYITNKGRFMRKKIEVGIVAEKLDSLDFHCLDLIGLNYYNEKFVLGEEDFAIIYDGGKVLTNKINMVDGLEIIKKYLDEEETILSKLLLKVTISNEEFEVEIATCNRQICKVSLLKIRDIINYFSLINKSIKIKEEKTILSA